MSEFTRFSVLLFAIAALAFGGCSDSRPSIPDCGNGLFEDGEECDDGNTEDGDGCSAACLIETQVTCGDDVAEGTEDCDGTDLAGEDCVSQGFTGGILGCAADCTFNTTGCTTADVCGDGLATGTEDCDGADLSGEDCLSQGFDGGTLACAADCTFNTSSCTMAVCGDGAAQGAEQCDGADLTGEDCLSMGYTGGALSCAGDCTFDFGACTGTGPVCGDGAAEGLEQCDGADLSGQDCVSQGFTGGVLACAGDCTFDTSACTSAPVCGDGAVEGTEQCDGADLAGEDCVSLGYTGGTLACAGDCTFDFGACTGVGPVCGDGSVQGTEQCDGADLAGADCVSLGFTGGTLGCAADCTFDVSGCSTGSVCGDGAWDPLAEGCDDGRNDDGDGCDANCNVEAGWTCSGSPSTCVTNCTDGDSDLYGTGAGCLGPDCDDTNPRVNPAATEVCNGIDDDCNSRIDEQSDEACYTGPSGTLGIGRCMEGTSYCVAGTLGPCVGQILPGAEACNLIDDDCDNSTDEGMPTLTCGIGECFASTNACVGGVVQQCIPGTPGAEQGNCNDGLDNDCNGLIDDCTCVHVAPFGNDTTGDGSEGNPYATIGTGIFEAGQPGQPPKVCVAGVQNCGSNNNWAFYTEDVVMVDGISVFGGYDPNTSPWVQLPVNPQTHSNPPAPRCVSEIQGQTQGSPAVLFDASVVNTTALDNFAISHQNPDPATSTVVLIQGSVGALLSNSHVFGSASGTTSTYGIHITDDPLQGGPATPLITSTSAEGGAGTLSVAIYSQRSTPTILASCSPSAITNNRCTRGCISGIHIRANRFTGGSAILPDVGYGVLLEDSPGAVIDQSSICGSANTDLAAVKIVGDATGTVISRSDIGVWGAQNDNGIWAQDCGGASPWIGDNDRIFAEGNQAGTATAAAVRATGDCHPVIEANQLLVGGIEGQVQNTRGVVCEQSTFTGVSSLCSIINNVEIRGCNSNFPASSIGVLCKAGSCNVISGNGLIWGRSGINSIGVQLNGATNAFVDKNRIEGGCGTTASIGIMSQDGAGRIQNNSIYAGICNVGPVAGGQFLGIMALLTNGVNELDIHSNYIHGGGIMGSVCTSRGISFDVVGGAVPPTGPLGVVRNNIIIPGDCVTNYAIEERASQADPRIVENNDLVFSNSVTALYLDETVTNLMTAVDVNAMTDVTASGNIDLDPMLTVLPGGFIQLDPLSPCGDAGTSASAPAWDYEDDPRPSGNGFEIGPDEI